MSDLPVLRLLVILLRVDPVFSVFTNEQADAHTEAPSAFAVVTRVRRPDERGSYMFVCAKGICIQGYRKLQEGGSTTEVKSR